MQWIWQKNNIDTAQSEQPIEWNERYSNNATYAADGVTQTVQPIQQMSVTQFNRYSRWEWLSSTDTAHECPNATDRTDEIDSIQKTPQMRVTQFNCYSKWEWLSSTDTAHECPNATDTADEIDSIQKTPQMRVTQFNCYSRWEWLNSTDTTHESVSMQPIQQMYMTHNVQQINKWTWHRKYNRQSWWTCHLHWRCIFHADSI